MGKLLRVIGTDLPASPASLASHLREFNNMDVPLPWARADGLYILCSVENADTVQLALEMDGASVEVLPEKAVLELTLASGTLHNVSAAMQIIPKPSDATASVEQNLPALPEGILDASGNSRMTGTD